MRRKRRGLTVRMILDPMTQVLTRIATAIQTEEKRVDRRQRRDFLDNILGLPLVIAFRMLDNNNDKSANGTISILWIRRHIRTLLEANGAVVSQEPKTKVYDDAHDKNILICK